MIINDVVIQSLEHLEEVIKDMDEDSKIHLRLIYEQIIAGQ
ncbi:MAG: hypothetical protein RLZZ181_595 [Pseudomonadota bacterium]|jgi:hypothetical protein